MTVKKNAKSLLEGVSESTAACMLVMVQGNIVGITLHHLMIAAQTGLIAGSLALTLGLMARIENRWIVPVLLACTTALVDYLIHPGSFGAVATEAIVTGIAAGLLSWIVGTIMHHRRASNTADM